ncbi:hypothetical protein HDV04_005645 [Boothiomyces sp. JEL0838]|nr:hypothetical protein HDV04_005645 [Boothiomyces sp. JEL0838]
MNKLLSKLIKPFKKKKVSSKPKASPAVKVYETSTKQEKAENRDTQVAEPTPQKNENVQSEKTPQSYLEWQQNCIDLSTVEFTLTPNKLQDYINWQNTIISEKENSYFVWQDNMFIHRPISTKKSYIEWQNQLQ